MLNGVNHLEHTEIKISAQNEVNTFLRNVWHHRLVDEQTALHRKEFSENFNNWCRAWELDPHSVVGVLGGSSLWSTHGGGHISGSDWDFTLYGPRKILYPFRERRHREYYNEHAQEMYPDWFIHPEKTYADTELINITSLAPLLLTPDNYVAGNLDLAHAYRKIVLRLKNPDYQQLLDFFGTYMKGWPEYTATQSRSGSRLDRYNDALRITGEEIAKGRPSVKNRFTQSFEQKRSLIEPPPLNVFKEAVKATGGKFILS